MGFNYMVGTKSNDSENLWVDDSTQTVELNRAIRVNECHYDRIFYTTHADLVSVMRENEMNVVSYYTEES